MKQQKIRRRLREIVTGVLIASAIATPLKNAYANKNQQNYLFLQNREQQIDSSALVKAIIQHESGGDPNALSDKLARGKMQIRAIVLKEYKKANPEDYIYLDDLYDPEINIKVGTWYLNRIINQYLPSLHLPINIDNAITAYHRGIDWLEKNGDATKNPRLPANTKMYIKSVKQALSKN